jgi:hypothetical protein
MIGVLLNVFDEIDLAKVIAGLTEQSSIHRSIVKRAIFGVIDTVDARDNPGSSSGKGMRVEKCAINDAGGA